MKSRILFNSIFKSDEWQELDSNQKLLSIYLITNESIGLIPAYKINEKEISLWLGLDVDTIKNILPNLEKMGIYQIDKYVVICNMFSTYVYHNGNNNKNREAMLKEFTILPENIQDKLLELGFDIEGTSMVPYGLAQGTSKVVINKKSEIRNQKQEIRNKKSREDCRSWLDREYEKTNKLLGNGKSQEEEEDLPF